MTKHFSTLFLVSQGMRHIKTKKSAHGGKGVSFEHRVFPPIFSINILTSFKLMVLNKRNKKSSICFLYNTKIYTYTISQNLPLFRRFPLVLSFMYGSSTCRQQKIKKKERKTVSFEHFTLHSQGLFFCYLHLDFSYIILLFTLYGVLT